MKNILPLLLILFAGSSCQNPCEKVYQKTVDCAQGPGLKKSLETKKETIIKLCGPFKDEVKECLGFEKCGDFNLCMKKVTRNFIGKTKKSRQERDLERKNKTEEAPSQPKKTDAPAPTKDITIKTED
ncbi:MAG: hypothetical protein PF689_00580 [Deltaproteobacteria bacterium]|jgi:hypothetical protein|nr:hypothetical protein [Deltaproteobacteria bacterium]